MSEVLENPHPTLDRMQLSPKFKVNVEVTGSREEAVTAFAIQYLKERGYHVAAPHLRPEKPGQFMKRIGITNWDSPHRDFDLWQQGGGALVVLYYPSGRIREIQSNNQFDQFVVRFKKA